MAIAKLKTRAEQTLAEQFQAGLPALPGNAAITARRKAAYDTFERTGLPGRRIESWHYTDWRSLTADALPPLTELTDADLATASGLSNPLASPTSLGALLVNNAVAGITETPEGVEIVDLAEAIAAGHPLVGQIGTAFPAGADPMVALNEAMFSGGLLVRVGKGVKLAKPSFATNPMTSGQPAAMTVRALVVVEDDAEITIVDSLLGLDGTATQINTVVEFVIGNNARVEYVTYNGAGDQTQVFTAVGVTMGANSTFNTLNFALGGKTVRHQVHVALKGEGATLGVRGVGLIGGEQHVDATLVVDHQARGCESRELFRNVVDGSGTGVFQGKIIVRQAAQKTDGRMASNAILLSDDASMFNKPELEIFADDVQCAHGATCGALDDDLLFYLQARGLPRAEAEALMVQAFVGEALEFVSDETVRDKLNDVVTGWLKARAKA